MKFRLRCKLVGRNSLIYHGLHKDIFKEDNQFMYYFLIRRLGWSINVDFSKCTRSQYCTCTSHLDNYNRSGSNSALGQLRSNSYSTLLWHICAETEELWGHVYYWYLSKFLPPTLSLVYIMSKVREIDLQPMHC